MSTLVKTYSNGQETYRTLAASDVGAVSTTDFAVSSLRRMIDISSISREIANATSTINVKMIGDSITAGLGGTGYNASSSGGGSLIYGGNYQNVAGACWANSLVAYLQSNFNCIAKNYGVSAITSTDIVNNLSSLIASTDNIIICMIGTNNRGSATGLTALKSDLVTIYNYVTNLGKEIIFMSSIPTTPYDDSTRHCTMRDIDNAIMEVTATLGIEYISLYKLFMDYITTKGLALIDVRATGDSIHPNDKGYGIMFHIILNQLGFGTPIGLMPSIYGKIAPNRNILHNWDFSNPVNQRGASSYSEITGYTIDRWAALAPLTVNVTSGKITVINTYNNYARYVQQIENPSIYTGKVVTFTVLGNVVSGGNMSFKLMVDNVTYGYTLLPNAKGYITGNITLPATITNLDFEFWTEGTASTIDLYAVKLEVGSISTLANDAPADYEEELLKCQRYYQLFRTQSLRPTYGEDHRPTMRISAVTQGSITIGSTTYYYSSADM